jgi:hypothetical protein
MTPVLEAKVAELLDREAIRECLYGYCRGIDRRDEAALRAAYWPDATDRHGAYSGSATGFVEAALRLLASGPRMIHLVGNVSIVLRGSVAAVESYFHALQQDRDAAGRPRSTMLAGRYVDRFEKRGGEWRVAQRTVVYDWIEESPGLEADEATRFGARVPNGRQRPDDPWYALLAQAPFAE